MGGHCDAAKRTAWPAECAERRMRAVGDEPKRANCSVCSCRGAYEDYVEGTPVVLADVERKTEVVPNFDCLEKARRNVIIVRAKGVIR